MITIISAIAAVIIAAPAVILIVPIYCIIKYLIYGKI